MRLVQGGRGYNINITVSSQFGDVEYAYLLGKLLQGLIEQYMRR